MNDFTDLPVPAADGKAGGGEAGQGASQEVTPSQPAADPMASRLANIEKMMSKFANQSRVQETSNKARELFTKVDAQITKAKSDVDAATTKLAEVMDVGDGMEVAQAQRNLGEATARAERVNAEAAQFKRNYEAQSQREQENAKSGGDSEGADTANFDSWKGKNSSWYGVDQGMTHAAHKIDKDIRALGQIEVGTPAYFEAIDRKMRAQFPERLSGSPGSPGQAPEGGGPAPGTKRVRADIADGWARMGFDIKDPAVVQNLLDARQTAVDKGILSQDTVSGRVLGR